MCDGVKNDGGLVVVQIDIEGDGSSDSPQRRRAAESRASFKPLRKLCVLCVSAVKFNFPDTQI
jgi:hypothetical protein